MLTSKQRAFLRSLAMNEEAILYLGKASLTPENTKNVDEALAKRELIKIGVQKNCADDPMELADMVAERTHAEVVQVIGKKIVLYRQGKDKHRKIKFP